MVAAHDFGVDGGVGDLAEEALAGDEVVDAPSGVLLPGLEAVGPPGVGDLGGVEGAEGVDEAAAEQLAELRALLVGEAGIAAVGLRVFQVYLLVGHVEVAAEDDGFLTVEVHEVGTEVVVPRHAVVEALEAVLRVGRVAVDEEEPGHFKCDDAPFVVVVVDAHAVGDRQGLVPGEDGGAGIAFLLGGVPINVVALEGQVELSGLHLCFLQAEEVGVELCEHIAEALALAGPQTVHVP